MTKLVDRRIVPQKIESQETSESLDQRPLRTAFCLTSMPVGGAETLLVQLVRSFKRELIQPSIVCLKEKGILGEAIASEVSVSSHWIRHKWDVGVARRLAKHFRSEKIDAVVTVGAGDKMFWGRIAARMAGVPVVCCALHSTGWPDGVGRLNRCLTMITDAFIGVAPAHGRFLVDFEKFPKSKVFVIPNGIDTDRFTACPITRDEVRSELGIPWDAPVLGIVAALRPEKNHALFVQIATALSGRIPDARFIIVGDGPERPSIERHIRDLGLQSRIHLLGNRKDIHRILTSMDVFALTSLNEANPVSILEALSCEIPVVASRVGSISESVLEGITGFTIDPSDCDGFVNRIYQLLCEPSLAKRIGEQGREHVLRHGSLGNMVAGYERLIHQIYTDKQPYRPSRSPQPIPV